jgi:hypothetical protein
VARLFKPLVSPGRHTAKLKTGHLNPGTYLLVIQTGDGYRLNTKVALTIP